jgi:flagellar capping protein FliD
MTSSPRITPRRWKSSTRRWTAYETQLSAVYSAMGTKLAALKATQTYLTNQIDAWNNSRNN